ncbi:uncharacterized protein LOC135955450 [Calliphora vicina]|uniref:uncharacterized protein LOC135955450 n=1 Tax=Calliphora vicina TaxID=7373 RepID=UPI00325BFBD9
MNKHLNIEWNIIIKQNSLNNLEMEDFLRKTEKSILLKTTRENMENETEIHNIFSHNVMTVIFQEEKHLEFIIKSLVKILKLIHFTTVLWIIDTDKEQLEYLQQISQLCWYHGFVRVLFLHNEHIYTYNPLPLLKVLKLSSIQEFYDNKDIVNYHQHPFRFPITSSPPRCYRYRDSHGNFIYAGYFYKILINFIQQYNFKFIEYPNDYHTDHMEDLLIDLGSGKMDAIPFMAYRNPNFTASDVLRNVHAIIVVPNAKPIPKYQYFEKPFKNEIWIIYLLLVLLSSTVLVFIVYFKGIKVDFSKSLLYVLSLAIYQHHLNIFKNSNLISNSVYICLFLYGFIMVQMYLCKLSSMLVLTIYEPQIKTIMDINSTDLKMFMWTNDLMHFSSVSAMSPIIFQRIIPTNAIDVDTKRRGLNISFFHMGFEDKIHFFMLQQKFLKVPLVQQIDGVVITEQICFTMRHNLPFIQLFNRYLKYMDDSGLLRKILNDIEWDGVQSGEISYFKDTANDNDHLLTLEYFYAPLVLYFGGVILSVIVFLMEIVYYKFKLRLFKINKSNLA